ncbi:hypothetical protein CBS101457_004260 [Exobasidium rhododendri]|nr:hypothetical protein CBS101457_004260 [Exobasidium rhododendri]
MALLSDAGNTVEAAVEEKELIQFHQAKEFRQILLSDDFYPGGLEGHGEGGLIFITAKDVDKQKQAKEDYSLRRLKNCLDEYQEQSYLLDPHLESIVVPPVKALQRIVRECSSNAETLKALGESGHVQRLASLLYYYTKVRGFKTIIHFFPHDVEDLLPTLAILELHQASDTKSSWEFRYILLLWLSLICMIPFDLVKFDDVTAGDDCHLVKTAHRIQSLGRSFLASPGKERDAATIVLGRLFQRKDASQEDFQDFLAWSRMRLLASPEPSIFVATGILQTLCNVVKALSPEALSPHVRSIQMIVALYSTDAEEVARAAGSDDVRKPLHYSNNSLVNRYKAKMACRLGLKALRPRKRKGLRGGTVLTDGIQEERATSPTSLQKEDREEEEEEEEEDEEVPEEIDAYIATLMDALQDKDTVVRYSAAKGLSRLCSRLPVSFVDQVSDAVTDLFSVNIPDLLGKKEDLSSVSEFTWQGCCLALAELARRGLLAGNSLQEKLEWVEKALLFDVRRGAHSIGTGVRDAACYVLWAIARAHEADSIRVMAERLSHRLVCVALLDRDVSIRRAASAAFQECVGRLNLFEDGIDIIRKTDFYAVGVRRNAFLECAPQVAVHAKYQEAILHHLLTITIIHWDISMRELGASTVAKIAQMDAERLIPPMVEQLARRCKSGDAAVLHGALTTLSELAAVCRKDPRPSVQGWCTTIFNALAVVPRQSIRALGPSMVLKSACRTIASSVTAEALQSTEQNSWDDFIVAALKRQEEDVQVEAAHALASVGHLRDCSDRIEAVIKDWKQLTVAQRQSCTRTLGVYDYDRFPGPFAKTITFLLDLVQPLSPLLAHNVETRRNAFESVVDAILGLRESVDALLEPSTSELVFKVLLAGLEDYTTDARGDVGSWIRLSCLSGMRRLLQFLLTTSKKSIKHWLDQSLFDRVIATYCKQMIEQIDNVRAQAAMELFCIASYFSPSEQRDLSFSGLATFNQIFEGDKDVRLKDPHWLLPRVIQLLAITEFRSEVVRGIVLYIGGQKEQSNRIVAKSLSKFLLGRECRSYGPLPFTSDVIRLAAKNVRVNRYFVPAVQTLNALFEESVMQEAVMETVEGNASLMRCLDLVGKNISVIKSVSRVIASMQYTTHMLAIPSLQSQIFPRLPAFLLHPFPVVRSSAAESLYSSMQDQLDEFPEEAEEILLSTNWSQTQPDTLQSSVDTLMRILSQQKVAD